MSHPTNPSLPGDGVSVSRASEGEPLAVCRVTCTHHGCVATAEVPADVDLVTGLLAAGMDVPYSCREGDCSSCVALVTQGAVECEPQDVLVPADVAAGYTLACISRPRTPTLAVSFDD